MFTWHATPYELLRSCKEMVVYTVWYSDWEVENINRMHFLQIYSEQSLHAKSWKFIKGSIVLWDMYTQPAHKY